VIDWSKAEPVEYVLEYADEKEILTFRVDQAVMDPDGDDLHYEWYWKTDGGFMDLMSGDDTSELAPCVPNYLSTAKYFHVTVVVSDGFLDPDKQGNTITVTAEEGHQMVQRVWLYMMKATCP
jgi:hypothetical protein